MGESDAVTCTLGSALTLSSFMLVVGGSRKEFIGKVMVRNTRYGGNQASDALYIHLRLSLVVRIHCPEMRELDLVAVPKTWNVLVGSFLAI